MATARRIETKKGTCYEIQVSRGRGQSPYSQRWYAPAGWDGWSAKKKNAELVLATDPDADRLGVLALDSETGEYKSFTGNMSALLIAEYILSQKKAKHILPKNGALITTIVSSNFFGVLILFKSPLRVNNVQ